MKKIVNGQLVEMTADEIAEMGKLQMETPAPQPTAEERLAALEQAGIERYGAVAKRASELGVKLALENTEGEEYLFALMEKLENIDSVCFCWDSGHELCYNAGYDLLKDFGDKLFFLHINDNMGVTGDKIFQKVIQGSRLGTFICQTDG